MSKNVGMKVLKHAGSLLTAIFIIVMHIYVDITRTQQGDFFELFINLAKDKKIIQYIFSLLMLYPIIVIVFSSISNIYKNCFSDEIPENERTRNKGLSGVILGFFALYLCISIILNSFNYEFKPLTIENLGLSEAKLYLFLLTTSIFFLLIFIMVLFISEKYINITVSMSIICLTFVYFTTSIRSYMIGALIGSWIAISLGAFLEDTKKQHIKDFLWRWKKSKI